MCDVPATGLDPGGESDHRADTRIFNGILIIAGYGKRQHFVSNCINYGYKA